MTRPQLEQRQPAEPVPDGLTTRDAEALAPIVDRRSNAEIVPRLFVTEATVKSDINQLFTKTGVRDGADAVT